MLSSIESSQEGRTPFGSVTAFAGLLSLVLILSAGCGASTGLKVDESDDAGVDTFVAPDVAPDTAPDTAPDAEPDTAPDTAEDTTIDTFECPDPIVVRGRDATVPIDIIWVIDSSGSMLDDLERMRANVEIFWDAMLGSEADFRVVFITPRLDAPQPPPGLFRRYRAIDYNVGSWEPLVALTSNFDAYDDFIRPDARTHFIAVTDDDSLAMEAEDFRRTMTELLGHDFTFHAVASERTMPTLSNPLGVCFTESSAAARPGRRYYELADATDGLKLSICQEDWSILYDQLTEVIAIPIPIRCAYIVGDDRVEVDPETLRVRYTDPAGEETFLPRTEESEDCEGFFYLEDRRRVVLCDRTCDDINADRGRIDLEVGCDE